ncbi:hypothetical protein CSUB01_12651, partial [Colletotrichum sublineola]
NADDTGAKYIAFAAACRPPGDWREAIQATSSIHMWHLAGKQHARRALIRQKHSLWRPRDVALAAERLWETMAADRLSDRTSDQASQRALETPDRSAVAEPLAKKPRIKNAKRCLTCFKKGHKAEDCYSKKVCSKCNKKGHIASICRAPAATTVNAIQAEYPLRSRADLDSSDEGW